ncbi:MAG: hypothetical protein ACM37W_01545 [Actinomycetota bacterium]
MLPPFNASNFVCQMGYPAIQPAKLLDISTDRLGYLTVPIGGCQRLCNTTSNFG